MAPNWKLKLQPSYSFKYLVGYAEIVLKLHSDIDRVNFPSYSNCNHIFVIISLVDVFMPISPTRL